MIDEASLFALCVFMEGRGEIPDGQAAIARVILERMRQKFFSDGTVRGTVLAYDQFSWAYFEYDPVEKKNHRIAKDFQQASAVAEILWAKYAKSPAMAKARSIVEQVRAGTYKGVLYSALTDKALLYCNLRVASPPWATPDKLVCVIGNHSFFRK